MIRTTRQFAFTVVFALIAAATGHLVVDAPANAQDASGALEAEARQALQAWIGAGVSGDPEAVRPLLAPEFQIVRADGSAYGADDYVAEGLPILAEMPVIEELVVTATDDQMVTRYKVNVNETIRGHVVQAFAPRLTVFRKAGDTWLVVAHANFAAIDE